jgi:hypothetical protein
MRAVHLSPGWGVVLLAVGLFTAFVLGDSIPGMVLAGWVIAFTGMIALSRGDPSADDPDSRG